MNSDLFYQIAVTLLPNVGPVNTKKLIALCGHPEAVFREKRTVLLKNRVPLRIVEAIGNTEVFHRAERELEFIRRHQLFTRFYSEPGYPSRLRHCEDGPVLLYGKGSMQLDEKRTISVVGTRNATSYGREFCETFIAGLQDQNVTVISGLAYGIDICAHRAAVRNGLQTIGILAHGLDRIYPSRHRETAIKMTENGGLLTDFASRTPFHPGNFPARNRIVAGLSDATIVIESASRGGSLITAEIANSYNREVFAVPGRMNDNHSRGCNVLIKQNKAALLESAGDLVQYMGWESDQKQKITERVLPDDLSENELKIVEMLKRKEAVFIDDICLGTQLEKSMAAGVLLNLEFKGVVKTLPGNRYCLN